MSAEHHRHAQLNLWSILSNDSYISRYAKRTPFHSPMSTSKANRARASFQPLYHDLFPFMLYPTTKLSHCFGVNPKSSERKDLWYTGPATLATPWRTLEAAINSAKAGRKRFCTNVSSTITILTWWKRASGSSAWVISKRNLGKIFVLPWSKGFAKCKINPANFVSSMRSPSVPERIFCFVIF